MKHRIIAALLAIGLVVTGGGFVGDFGVGRQMRAEDTAAVEKTENSGIDIAYGAQVFPDVRNHWSLDYVVKAINYGIVQGYEDGTFGPDKAITRAEFCTMVNNAFGNKEKVAMNFKDLDPAAWYYDQVAKGVAAGYVQGYEDGTFREWRNITRAEASTIAHRLIPYTSATVSLRTYTDEWSVQSWAYEPMQVVMAKKYLYMRDAKKLHPEEPITRAESVKLICDIVDKERVNKENISITKKDALIRDQVFANGLVIDKAVGDGKVTIKNCVILGSLDIQGGGSESVYIENTRIGNCLVNRADGDVRVVAEGLTTIRNTTVANRAILEEDNLSKTALNPGFNALTLEANSMATLENSTLTDAKLIGKSASLILHNSKLNSVYIDKEASGAYVSYDKQSDINVATANAPTAFYGQGRLNKLYANAEPITYERIPSFVYTGKNLSKPEKATADMTPIVNPADGAVDVAFDKSITLTFKKPIQYYNGKALTKAMIKDAINLTVKKANGTPVEFDAEINASDTVITIKPTKPFSKKTKYYVSFAEAEFKDQDDNYNMPFSSMFTTGDGTVDGVKFKPENGAYGVSKTIKPSIKFADTVKIPGSRATITPTYLKRNISMRKLDVTDTDEDSYEKNGKEVSFMAEIDKKFKTITITPKTTMAEGEVYYLSFAAGAFEYAETGEAIKSQYIIFTVGQTSPVITFTPTDGAQYYSNSANVIIAFSEPVYDAEGKEPTPEYLKNNITFRDNTGGTDIAFTASISSSSTRSTIWIDPVSLLPDAHEFTVTLGDKKFKTGKGKEVAKASTSFTSGSTTPFIQSLTATGTTSKIAVKLQANMNATGYIRVVPAATTLKTAAEVKAGGTKVTTVEGKEVETSVAGTYTGGETYRVYAVVETGSKITNVSETSAIINRDVAEVSSITVSSEDGAGFKKSDSPGETKEFTYSLPYGTNTVRIEAAPKAAGDKIYFDTADGRGYVEGIAEGGKYYAVVSGIDGKTQRKVGVKAVGTNKVETVYGLTLGVTGNTSLGSITVEESIGELDGGKTFVLQGGALQATVLITAADPLAEVTCTNLSRDTAEQNNGIGKLKGTVIMSGTTGELTLEITIKSNADSATYNYTLKKLN